MSKNFIDENLKKKLEIMNKLTPKGVLIWTNLLFEVLQENLPDHVYKDLMEKHIEKITKSKLNYQREIQ